MTYLKITMDGDNRWLGPRIRLGVSKVLGWDPFFPGAQRFYGAGTAALGRSLHCGGCSEAVGETPARCKAHSNPQCFLLQMLGALFTLASHRNTDYWALLNGLHWVPIWETPARKNPSTVSRNEACMTDIHQVLHGITGWGSHGPCEHEQCRTGPKM